MILTKEERENLLAVKTTKKEARTMKMRFERLLEALKKTWPPTVNGKGVKIKIGCPHCETAYHTKNSKGYRFNCGQCAYTNSLIDRGEIESGYDFGCVEKFTFGEVDYEMTNHLITLDRTHIELTWLLSVAPNEEREDLETFAKGHIEWANLVLKQKTKK